jgi:hypothetical protein
MKYLCLLSLILGASFSGLALQKTPCAMMTSAAHHHGSAMAEKQGCCDKCDCSMQERSNDPMASIQVSSNEVSPGVSAVTDEVSIARVHSFVSPQFVPVIERPPLHVLFSVYRI